MEQRSATALSHLNQQMTDVPIADLQPLGSFALRELLLPHISQHALSEHLDSGGNKASYQARQSVASDSVFRNREVPNARFFKLSANEPEHGLLYNCVQPI
jgi:hypothetical protein